MLFALTPLTNLQYFLVWGLSFSVLNAFWLVHFRLFKFFFLIGIFFIYTMFNYAHFFQEQLGRKAVRNVTVKESRKRPGVTQRVPGGLGSQIS